MKQYDVHFILEFSDCISSIEANSIEEAEAIARDLIANPGMSKILLNNIKRCLLEENDFGTRLTDIIEL